MEAQIIQAYIEVMRRFDPTIENIEVEIEPMRQLCMFRILPHQATVTLPREWVENCDAEILGRVLVEELGKWKANEPPLAI